MKKKTIHRHFVSRIIQDLHCRKWLIALNDIYLENRAQLLPQTKPPIWDSNGEEDPEIIVGGWLQ